VNNTLQLKIITTLQDKLSAPMRRITGASNKGGQAIGELQKKLGALEQTQKVVNQFRQVSNGLRDTSTKMQQAQQRVAQLANSMRQMQAPTKAVQREFKQAVAASQKLKHSWQQQSERLQQLRDRLSSTGISTRSLASAEVGLRSNIARTTDALRQQTAQLEKVEQRQRKMAAAREQMNKGMMRTAAIAGTGVAAKMTGMHLGRKMVSLLHVGYEFEAQMSALQGVTRIADKDDPRMQALNEQARTLPLSSKFTDLEVAQGQFYLGRTGYTPEQILAAMPHMLTLATAGEMDLATTADIASNIQTAFGIPRDQMQRVADVLSAMFTRNNVNIQMLGQSLKYSAVVGKEFGQSFESVTAATALLGNAGIQGDMAGTTMRQILLRIGSSKTMKNLGIKTHDEKGNMRDLTDLLVDIGKVTGPMGNVLRGEIFKDISDQRALAAFSTLVAKAQTGELQEMIAVAHNAQGEAEKLKAIQMDNLKGDMSVLRAALENISIELFEKNEGLLRSIVQTAIEGLHAIKNFLEENPTISKAIVMIWLGLSGLLTVFGSLTMALATLLGPFILMRFAGVALGGKLLGLGGIITKLGRALKWLRGIVMLLGRALLMNPIGLAISAIAGAVYLIYKYWKPIKEFFVRRWQEIRSAFDGGIWGVTALLLNWSPLGQIHRAFAEVLAWFGIDIPKKFTEFGTRMVDSLVQGIKNTDSKIKNAFIDLMPDWPAWFHFHGAGDAIAGGVHLIDRHWDQIKIFSDNLWQKIKSIMYGIIGINALLLNWSPLGQIHRAFAKVLEWLGFDVPQKLTDLGKLIIDSLVNGIKSMGKKIKGAFTSLMPDWPALFRPRAGGDALAGDMHLFDRYGNYIQIFFTNLGQKIVSAIGDNIMDVNALWRNWSPLDPIRSAFAKVLAWFSIDIPKKFTEFGTRMVDSLVQGIKNAGNKIKDTFFSLMPDWSALFQFQSADEAIEGMDSAVQKAVGRVAEGALQWFKDKLGIHSPSRAFAEVSKAIPEGAALGIARQQPLAEKAAQMMAAGVLAAGAAAMSTPAVAAPALTFDTRPPITAAHLGQARVAAQAQQPQVLANTGGDQIEIHIHATPGMGAQDIAAAVSQELDKRAREKQARQRSSLWDIT